VDPLAPVGRQNQPFVELKAKAKTNQYRFDGFARIVARAGFRLTDVRMEAAAT
jgi:hypothetical protein